MKYQISKIDAAVAQLDWAIKLFLNEKAYVPAITLAGAAEEIIGETLSSESTFRLLKVSLSDKYGIPEKVISQDYLNKTKNWLKHWKEMKDKECLEIELETEAIQYLIRGIANLVTYDRSVTSETPRFLAWINENRKDLVNGL